MTDATKAKIARVDQISALARSSWIGLLAYLAFVFVTLLGVKDADFFVPSRETQLPLINVSIPTASFFYFAPILGSALYIYLHLFLLKLWDAINDARHGTTEPLGDLIHPWLVNTLATSMIGGNARTPRPLDWLSNSVTWILVWLSGPFVLAWAWWRSMPAHDEVLTATIALSLMLSLIAGAASWWRARARLNFAASDTWQGRWKTMALLLAFLTLAAFTWLRTERGLDDYRPGYVQSNSPVYLTLYEPPFRQRLHGLLQLAATDLADEQLVPLPTDWRNPETARREFRETWCRREGLPMNICGHLPDAGRETPKGLWPDRFAWCTDHQIPEKAACVAAFADRDTQFRKDWAEERQSDRDALPTLDLSGKDLRKANLVEAHLVGAILRGARMEGADLRGARMEGTDFREARMEGAFLWEAQMEGADLRGARMERAYFRGARMEGADLREARMGGADLMGARMEGADLRKARMEGTYLWEADFRSADWAATYTGLTAQSADLRGASNLTQAQLDQMIGNAETLLPEMLEDGTIPTVPSCWETKPDWWDRVRESWRNDWLSSNPTEFLCSPGQKSERTGTPLALDAPYPNGHPMANLAD